MNNRILSVKKIPQSGCWVLREIVVLLNSYNGNERFANCWSRSGNLKFNFCLILYGIDLIFFFLIAKPKESVSIDTISC